MRKKIGRNQPCPCGSGKKFKRCHGLLGDARYIPDEEVRHIFDHHQTKESIRQAQQGRGKPIISATLNDHQVVAVGKTLHWSTKWKTFPDFLSDYIKTKIGGDWGNSEITKPFAERHPLIQWYDAICRYQQMVIETPGVPALFEVTGIVACYLGVSYGLYLLDHNVELQERLIRRLKNPGNFQGAYYELQVASSLILAGFDLTLEDETDPKTKHCEFAAVSRETGKKYWVEAKMRGVVGLLGRTDADGTRSPNPLSHMVRHLNGAFAKPAADDRIIFIDLNADMPPDVSDENRPDFVAKVTKRLERYEQRELRSGNKAYVFVTNSTFHRNLGEPAQFLALPFGLGMPDFNRAEMCRFSDRYRQDRNHADAFRVADGLSKLISFPSTFDGSLPSTSLHGERPPVVIGQSYIFEGAGPDGNDLVGTVTDATVIESEKAVTVAVLCPDGKAWLLKEQMSDQQLADYKAHADAYFGKIRRQPKGIKSPQDLFEFFMAGMVDMTRDDILRRLASRVPGANLMNREDLLAVYCEGLVSAADAFEVEDGIITSKP